MNKSDHKVWLRVDLPELTYWPYWKLWPWNVMWGNVDMATALSPGIGLNVGQMVAFERWHVLFRTAYPRPSNIVQVKYKHLYLNR